MLKLHSKRELSEAMFLGMAHKWAAEDTQFKTATQTELCEAMQFCMKRVLNYRQKSVVELRMQDMTLDEVAAVFKVTRERIRQIEGKAIRRLQALDVARNLFEFLEE